jgi:hypothetical protein
MNHPIRPNIEGVKHDQDGKVIAFTINRSRWLRRTSPAVIKSLLMRERDGAMCCLGFYSVACGVAMEHIVNWSVPGFEGPKDDWRMAGANWLLEDDNDLTNSVTPACRQLINDNDSWDIDESTKEAKIAAGFAAQGITVTFAD